jgi:hypothetical protein
MTTNLQVGGLPFTAASVSMSGNAPSFVSGITFSSSNTALGLEPIGNTTTIAVYQIYGTAGPLPISGVAATARIDFTLSYEL